MARIELNETIKAAWDWLWADNLRQRKAGHDWKGSSYYLTATDLEQQVRSFVQERLDGKPQGSRGRGGYGYATVRISTGGRGSLLNVCRDWLLNERRNGRLESHNFGKGHISGMRFRPAGEPIGERESHTIKQKAARAARPRLYHYAASWSAPLACVGRRRGFGQHRSNARRSPHWEDVTCPRCLKKKSEIKSEVH